MLNVRQKFDPLDLEIVERVYEVGAPISRLEVYMRTLQNMPKRKPRFAKPCLPGEA
jgi:hypothetical protein